jgi:hypothetical protein
MTHLPSFWALFGPHLQVAGVGYNFYKEITVNQFSDKHYRFPRTYRSATGAEFIPLPGHVGFLPRGCGPTGLVGVALVLLVVALLSAF